MFAYFPLSFGMANVRQFLDMMGKHPAFITNKESGGGFAEVVERILQSR